MRIFSLIMLLFFLVTSCNNQVDDGWIAQYNDDVITSTELKQVMPKGLSEDDSLKFVNAYIKNWVKSRVLISESEELLSDDEIRKIEQKVAKYREDLMEIMIEDKLIAGFSDTISEQELQQYYRDFPETFILKNDIISYRLMEIPQDSARSYKEMLRKDDIEELRKKLQTYGYYHDFKPDNWIEKEKLLSSDLLPERLKNQNLMTENQIYTDNKNESTFVFQTLETGKSGKAAPYAYIKPTIKNVVLNKRKLNLLSKKKNELYQKVLENDEIKRK